MTLEASRLMVLAMTPPHPSSSALPITLAFVPGGPDPMMKGLGSFSPLTTVSSVAIRTPIFSIALDLRELLICFGPAVAEELPGVSHFLDLIKIEIGDDQFILVARCDGEHLPARVAEIAL